ncbi:MAG: hypothetical protein RLZZ275_112 [Bacteroidota bacterium]|jgi:hypothetical protein
MALVAFSALNISSMCHPSEEGKAAEASVRRAAEERPEAEPLAEANGAGSLYEGEEAPSGHAAPPSMTAEELAAARAAAPPPVQGGNFKELTWKLLEDVTFKDVYLESLESYYWKPTFGPTVKAAAGKPYFITGYVIPVDIDENFYVLSRYPFANCFFCGGAGPESVVDLRFKGNKPARPYQTDERLTFAGTLRLNADDIYQMNYILDGAVEYRRP